MPNWSPALLVLSAGALTGAGLVGRLAERVDAAVLAAQRRGARQVARLAVRGTRCGKRDKLRTHRMQ